MEVFTHVFSTPYFWSALGSVVAITMFMGPILYNGDVTLVSKSVIGVGVYAVFLALLLQSHVIYIEQLTSVYALQPLVFVGFLTLAYVVGLYLGVLIHKFSKNRIKKVSRKRINKIN